MARPGGTNLRLSSLKLAPAIRAHSGWRIPVRSICLSCGSFASNRKPTARAGGRTPTEGKSMNRYATFLVYAGLLLLSACGAPNELSFRVLARQVAKAVEVGPLHF